MSGQNHGQTLKIQWFFLSEICTDTHLQASCGRDQFEKVLLGLQWEKVLNWDCLLVHRKQRLFSSVYVDDIRMAGRKQDTSPVWKKNETGRSWTTNIISWSCILGMHSTWLQAERNYYGGIQKIVRVTNFCYSNWKHCLSGRNFTQKKPSSPTMWMVMRRSTLKDIVSWRTKGQSNRTTSQLLAWSLQEGGTGISWRTVKSMLRACLEMSVTWQDLVDLTFFWSVNKLARAVTIWTQACDRRPARLISNIHHANDFRQCCHVGNTAQHCRLGLFQDSDFAADFEDSKSTLGGALCIFGK